MLMTKTRSKRRQSPERSRRLTGDDGRYDKRAPNRWRRRWLYGAVLTCMFLGYTLIRHHTETSLQPPSPTSELTKDIVPTRRISTTGHIHLPTSDEVQYLAYYPHGGFHTQRIALENALTLCRLLDRTLLLPPLWIGRQLPWRAHPGLYHGLGNTNKSGLAHCELSQGEGECEGWNQWSQVGWEWLIDVAMTDVDWVSRWNFTDEWLHQALEEGGLGLQEGDFYRVNQTVELGIQVIEHTAREEDIDADADADELETPTDKAAVQPHHPYTTAITLNDLRYIPQRLLHFDSLAGANRLLLTNDRSRWIKNEIRASIVLSNSLILEPAKAVMALLGGPDGSGYIALDARLDGKLAATAGRSMRAAWWELGRRMGVADSTLEQKEREVWKRSPGWRESVAGTGKAAKANAYPPPPDRLMDSTLADARAQRPPAKPQKISALSDLPCPRLLHLKPSLLPLNKPLFISTAIPDPQSHPALRLFYSTYPCIFTLDTPEIKAVVHKHMYAEERLVNDLDGYELGPWLERWVGAEVAVRGAEMVGTSGSAWSKWAEEMVQPIAKGWAPIFRD